MKFMDEITDELKKARLKRLNTKPKNYRKKEWYNGYIKGLEMGIYLYKNGV